MKYKNEAQNKKIHKIINFPFPLPSSQLVYDTVEANWVNFPSEKRQRRNIGTKRNFYSITFEYFIND